MSTDEAVAPQRRATFHEVLAIREFRALYVAQVLSVAGDQLARIAISVMVFDRSGSAFLTGLTYAVSYLPWLVGGPLLSGYADRKPRRTVMIICDLGRAVVVVVLAIPGVPTSALLVLVAVVALGEPPFASARSSLIPDVVGEGERYAVASTLSNTSSQLAVVIGFAAGGALVATIGPHLSLIVDAATFCISAWLAYSMFELRPAAKSDAGSLFAELSKGASIVFHNRELRWLVVTAWLMFGVTVSTESAAVPFAHAHGGGSGTAGLLIASLPSGVILGGLVLGRALTATASERLMLPLALATPAVLALTAFDERPAVTAAIWFLAGCLSSVTIIANRVFVARVPRDCRGQAFGIAVTGIAAAQGVYTGLTGLIARYTGTAHAVANLALPTFALLVMFSVGSASFSKRANRPIAETVPSDDEDLAMPARPRSSDVRVWALNGAILLVGIFGAYLFRNSDSYVRHGLPTWWLLLLFVIALAYPLRLRYGRHGWDVSLEAVPLTVGLIFASPVALIGTRVFAVVLTFAVGHRQRSIRWVFNAAGHACTTALAVVIFREIVPSNAGAHPAVWISVFLACFVDDAGSAALLGLGISISDRTWRFRESLRGAALSTPATVVMGFLGLSMAAALNYDTATAWAITVFVVLSVAGVQTYHRLAERTAALDRLYGVARELGPTTASPNDLAPALMQLRRIMNAGTLELEVVANEPDFNSIVTVNELADGSESADFTQRPIEAGGGSTSGLAFARSRRHRALQLMRIAPGSSGEMSTPVRSGDRELGRLLARVQPGGSHAFDRGDLRLLEAAAGQLAAALEKGRLVENLRRAATLDKLTGLANLDSLRSFLDTSLEGSPGGVLILVNIDRFREVNDMLGHEAGDAVLAEVARRLQTSQAPGALYARVGGDQFAIALPGAAGSEVARLAGMAVKSRVDGSLRLAEVSADVRVTVGIARAPEHGNDSATLLRRAEMAMTAAKGGSTGIGEWEPNYEKHGSRRLQLLTGLRSALSNGSLRVEYQPKLWLGSGEISGFEALVRWTHPELGPVSPAEFVPLAEATGLISALTSTVLRQALSDCRQWHDAGKPVGVAVNVSARSLDDNVLVGQVAAMLTASGLEPRWLTLEITESSVMEDQARSLEVLRELRMLGVRLSIDDFGTGYSSLHQLRGLPVHEVKIDRSFVETLDVEEADRAVVRAVVELCESLSLTTVAEGVEKASQAHALETLGVRQVQGYFHGRPMDLDATLRWLAARPVAALASS